MTPSSSLSELHGDLIRIYCGLMEEIKTRADLAYAIADGELPIEGRYAEEICYLQVRMICELIAIGCLLAHNDVRSENGGILKLGTPDQIFDRLEQTHPDFYPKPVEQWQDESGRLFARTRDTPSFTKEELKALRGQCGNMLHRSDLRKVLPGDVRPHRLTPATDALDKIRGLLDPHVISIKSTDLQLWVVMQVERTGRTEALVVHRDQPPGLTVVANALYRGEVSPKKRG